MQNPECIDDPAGNPDPGLLGSPGSPYPGDDWERPESAHQIGVMNLGVGKIFAASEHQQICQCLQRVFDTVREADPELVGQIMPPVVDAENLMDTPQSGDDSQLAGFEIDLPGMAEQCTPDCPG